jgi:phosphotransferase system HPr (HPr) family protein
MRTFDEEDGTRRRRIETTGRVKVRAAHGLSATVARSVVEAARRFGARAALTAYDGRGRGHRADGRNLLELLLLGAGRGDCVTVECVGDDADAAFEAIAAVLGHGPDEYETHDEEVES